MPQADLGVTFCGVRFQNPFMLSSSPVSNTAGMCARAYDAGWGGVVYKTLGLEESFKIVMPSPRLSALHDHSRRFIGLQNAEQISDRPIKDNIADIRELKTKYPDRVLVSSLMGYSDKDWITLAEMSAEAGADMLELNFSCPQMARKDAGHHVGQDSEVVREVTAVVKQACDVPVMAKMTPNITDMVPIAVACKEGGADAISAINTIKAITDVDIDEMTPTPNIHHHSAATGFSGTAAKPIGLRFVSDLYLADELGLPISAIGGVTTWRDALHYMLLGGTTVQVTTAVMRYGYRIVSDMIEGLSDYMIDRDISSLDQIIGQAAQKIVDPSDFSTRYQVIAQIDQDKCVGCGQCFLSCRDGANQAIQWDPLIRKPHVAEERCVGCTLCSHVCPVWDCISIKEIDTATTRHAALH